MSWQPKLLLLLSLQRLLQLDCVSPSSQLLAVIVTATLDAAAAAAATAGT
jgi:hypothetical protein